MKTEFIRARMEPKLKIAVHHIFRELGITPSQALNIFYKTVEREHGIPFELYAPNQETVKAIREARERKGVKAFKNADDLFKDLES